MTKRILIAEDDTAIAMTLMIGLRSIPDVEVIRAYHGEEALNIWLHEPCDILLTDHHMREMSGLDLIRALRSQGATQPMLMITAYDSVKLQREAREAGATELIAKPFFIDQLIDKVSEKLLDVSVVNQA
ncbi:response regulator [Herpetosiphon gulosus]|uniref:Response regulator MprA n=1 Tax=Herpetosiphon gulosus TaxID=1973496 RepID=A0ABP9X691_9CHLR